MYKEGLRNYNETISRLFLQHTYNHYRKIIMILNNFPFNLLFLFSARDKGYLPDVSDKNMLKTNLSAANKQGWLEVFRGLGKSYSRGSKPFFFIGHHIILLNIMHNRICGPPGPGTSGKTPKTQRLSQPALSSPDFFALHNQKPFSFYRHRNKEIYLGI